MAQTAAGDRWDGSVGCGEDPRLGSFLQARPDAETRVVLLGFPCDTGVVRNGGRPGSFAGPAAIREALYRLTPDARRPEPSRRLLARTCDLGDVEVRGDLGSDQERLGEAVAEQLAAKRRVVVLGGGHETTFGHFLGYVGAGLLPVSLLNLDAHPDVRPLVEGAGHSGSPFRQALEHGDGGSVASYHVAGLQPSSVASAHLGYLREREARFQFAEELGAAGLRAAVSGLTAPALVSLDLDVVDAAQAPGVSAPGTGGLAASLLLEVAEEAGRTEAVRSLDVVELCPPADVDGRTARLAALAVWRFLAGVAAAH